METDIWPFGVMIRKTAYVIHMMRFKRVVNGMNYSNIIALLH